MKNPFSKHPVKTILGIGMIASSIIIGMRFIDTALTVADIDPEYTADWGDLCVGRFKMKVPKDFINDEMKIGFLYDGIHIEQLPGAYDTGSFAQFISAKESEIKKETAAIRGVEAIVVKERNEPSYLVAYRYRERQHTSIKLRAYRLMNGRIIKLWVDTLDGIDDGPFGAYAGKREQKDAVFQLRLKTISRIIHQLTPITDVKKVGKGLCLSNEVILAGEPETVGYETSVSTIGGRYNKAGSKYRSIRLDIVTGGHGLSKSARVKAFQHIAAGKSTKLSANGMSGFFEYLVNPARASYKEFIWYYLDPKRRDIYRPDIKIEVGIDFKEEISQKTLEQFFFNVMASFQLH